MDGVVAAGHPMSAEAGAEALRRGGNAIDAAVGAALASLAVESPLTGLGAGGFMNIRTAAGEETVVDFFVEAPGRDGTDRSAELEPVDVHFDATTTQVFNVGPASCGIPGFPAGIAHVLERFGTMPMAELCEPAVWLARDGAPVSRQQAYLFEILAPIYTRTEELRSIYAPEGRMLAEGETFRIPVLGDTLERFAADGPDLFYTGDIGLATADHVRGHGGTLSRADMAAYRPVEREPVAATFGTTRILTNPPPSSGGILIAFVLEILERLGRTDFSAIVAAMSAANAARGAEFSDGLREPGFADRFLEPSALDAAAAEIGRTAPPRPSGSGGPEDHLGSTTHLVAVDSGGNCASLTCSNGTGSGVLVPGTGVHLNNMLGEEDLNPLGFHLTPVGARMPSMMSPTIVLRDGEVVAGLGSAGSNRIRSAVLATIVGLVTDGLPPAEAIEAPRVHVEAGTIQAEPGVDEEALRALEAQGYPVVRWAERNLFFGGVQAVARDPQTGALSGAGDPRRGGTAKRG